MRIGLGKTRHILKVKLKILDTMNTEIQIFKDDQFGQLRGMNINGEAWLMATDVARKLGYTNPQKAIRDHIDAIE